MVHQRYCYLDFMCEWYYSLLFVIHNITIILWGGLFINGLIKLSPYKRILFDYDRIKGRKITLFCQMNINVLSNNFIFRPTK